jgi:hypothetical protein
MIVSEDYSLAQEMSVPAAPAVAAPTSSWTSALTTGITALAKGAEVYGAYKASKVKPPKTYAPASAPSFAPQYHQNPTSGPVVDVKMIAIIGVGSVAVLGLVYFLTRK